VKISDFRKTKNGYLLKFESQKKYMKMFSEALMDNKEEIFKYVKEFYFRILNERTDFPDYLYKK
jgi:hypothetical protein